MSIRRPDEELELGNRIATLLVALPIGETDPAARLAQIHAETTRLKASEQARAASLVIEATGWTPPTINRVLAGGDRRGRLRATSSSPTSRARRSPSTCSVARLEAIYPFVPLSPQNHALSIGVLSYDGGVFFGLAGDRDVIADIDELALRPRGGARRADRRPPEPS